MRVASLVADGGVIDVRYTDAGWIPRESDAEKHRARGSLDQSWPVASDVAVLASPARPKLLIGLMRNVTDDGDRNPPNVFLKSPHTISAPGSTVQLKPTFGTIVAEAEVAIVVGKTARNLNPGNVADAIFGYTIANDITELGTHPFDQRSINSKNGDGFTPLGPWIETDLDPENVALELIINGAVVRAGNTARLAWGVTEQLIYLSTVLTLQPGDVILTGHPAMTAPLSPGDTVEIRAEGIGSLVHRVS